jgi:ribosomal-protein-alanine N-acetyltransferase
MGESPPKLRLLKNGDIWAVYVMERENFIDPWSLENLQDELARPFSVPLGLFRDDKLLAYSFSWLIQGETHLLNLSVGKPFQGMGLGRRLLAAVITISVAKGSERVHLEVSEANARAIALYKSEGFKAVGRRKAYYGDKSDAILMTLTLGPKKSGAPGARGARGPAGRG